MNIKKNMQKKTICTLLVAIIVIAAAIGVFVYARYISESRREAEIKASVFHISSNYLDENGTEYSVFASQDGIHFTLNNFEKENVALISKVEISYTITVKLNGTDVTNKFNLTNDNGFQKDFSGKLKKDARETQDFWLQPKDGVTLNKDEVYTVIAKTTDPYIETISAKFVFTNKPNSEIYDAVREGAGTHGDRYVVTVKTNAYSGKLKMVWGSALVPDNTNIHMDKWNGTEGVFDAEPYTTYTFIFFNPNGETYVKSDFAISPVE